MASKPLTIGTVAKRAGVGVETIRFYERENLIEAPPRRESGYREYPETTVMRVRFICRAKELGFSLHEIRELLSLRLCPGTGCEDVRRHAEAKIAQIEEKMRTLERMKAVLDRLTDACRSGAASKSCPILEALEGEVVPS